ncbi:SWIM zinc finger family protein [Streptomyces roseicoloratus]|uniref:SWIM zinc finger family protein n=1 Tax=Streptomyces roseicoloratus TaxID=2508722 RepID=A0ABY9RTD9_9ACTN|nr:SWIM zinc finger family protein [Streptomyces roseicoloratus]WMX45446.1 SWIM zinc finger family protein [Streptomyces roseicoloratus]
MTEQGVRWTSEQVLALAPDDASRRAGSKLGSPGPWSGAGRDGRAVWGLCKGSGRTPYRTVVDTAGPAYACSCPSRKFPCKHALGLLLLWAGDAAGTAVPTAGEAPDWAAEWLAGRRARAEAAREGAARTEADGGPADPEAARRRAERRAARITAGAQELEQRLADLLRGGLASAERAGYGLWEETAARMVDAQAPGLAGRVRELGAVAGSGPGWPVRLLEECALTHLLDRAWLAVDTLPGPLAATVRGRVGLPSSPEGPVLRDDWLVLAQYDTADARLTTRRIWLHGRSTGHTALLLSYGAAGRAPQLALPVGAVVDAELRPYGSGGGLRAELVEQFGTASAACPPPPGTGVAAALAAYGGALREDPWLDSWPVTLSEVVPARAEYGWQLADAAGTGPGSAPGTGPGTPSGTRPGTPSGTGAGTPSGTGPDQAPGAAAGTADGADGTSAAIEAADGTSAVPGGADGPPGTAVGTAGREAVPLTRAAQAHPGLWRLVALSGGGPVRVFGEVGHQGFTPLAAWSPDEPGETVPLV